MSKRKATDDEKALFKKTVAAARPAIPAAAAKKKAAGPRKAAPPQLDGNTEARLKRGAMAPQARIDLHGMTESAAHRALLSFLANAGRNGVKLALVITGVGNPHGEDDAPWMRADHGVLKQMVPRWLNESDFAALIVGFGPAHRRHGGDGALYVYLRKSR